MSHKRSNSPAAGPSTVPVTLQVPRDTWAHLEAVREELGKKGTQTGPARVPGRSETYLWLVGLGLQFLGKLAQDSSARIPGPVDLIDRNTHTHTP